MAKTNKYGPAGKRLREIYTRLLDAFGPQHWWPGETPLEVAIGAVLTQNTNWGNVERAIRNLKMANALSGPAIDRMSNERLAELVRPSGYFNVKAARLKAFVSFLMNGYRGDFNRMKCAGTARLREKLLAVNGIGPETADSILLYALEKPVFVIDAYTKRILARHKIVSLSEDWDYPRLQGLFHQCLEPDVDLYNEYHALLVRAGKTFCRPRAPLCRTCPLSEMEPQALEPRALGRAPKPRILKPRTPRSRTLESAERQE
ncbi:MAG: hypothetical protein M0Z58_03670 [Nitrospiraceae bacterium]|nr:hypothetical protein [Nitrospiraceae bacterium]